MFFEFALIGTTASGKSALASALASKFNAYILSLDSLCVYKQINIASAKPKDLDINEYFGLNLLNIDEPFNVAFFVKEYDKAKKQALKSNRPLIIVGGTSFYLKILMQGLSQEVSITQNPLSNDEIYALMQKMDTKAKIAKNDTYRLRKWLSIYEYSKEIPSEFLKRTLAKPLIEKLEIFELVWDKEMLKQRIFKRTKTMLEQGLIEEASFLFKNYDENLKALNSIGLKECKDFLKGKSSKKDLEENINIHTAQLAKRQRTFNKKFKKTELDFDKAFYTLEKKYSKN